MPYPVAAVRGKGGAVVPGYFVDAVGGNDSNTGLSAAQAWKTIAKVNGATFQAGDTIQFKQGDLWREELVFPRSTLNFGAYGGGARPQVFGSVVPSSWTQELYVPTPSITKKQDRVNVGGTTSVTASFPLTPVQGNLLIACLSCTGSTAGISSASMSSSGFSMAISAVEGTGNGWSSIWYKVAGASESKDVTATVTGGLGTQIVIEEW